MSLSLNSSAFAEGARMPAKYTCDGQDLSPPITWSGAPPGTLSFVLICDDPDAPMGTWSHWAVYNIPAAMDSLEEGFSLKAGSGPVRQAVNDFNRVGYGSPCPPIGHGTHRYHFRLLALGVERLDLGDRARCKDVERAAEAHLIERAEYMGTYSR